MLVGDPSTWSASDAHEIALGTSFASGGYPAGLSCSSVTACVAIGSDNHGQPFSIVGDPSGWSAAQAREITLGSSFGSSGYPAGLSCTSATACTAVGSDGHGQPFTLVGDPSTWTAAQAREIVFGSSFGSGGFPSGLSCTSATACVATGTDNQGQPFSIGGNPSSWTAAQAREVTLGSSFGSGGFLAGLACPQATFCVAVGADNNGQPLSIAGNPSTWTAAQAREITLGSSFGPGSYPSAVACTAATSCVAVGSDGQGEPLTLVGDPSSWGAAQTSSIPLKGLAFGAQDASAQLACASATACINLGSDYGPGGGAGPFILQGDPATWDQATPTLMSGVASTFGNLASASCSSSTHCVAVGSDYNGNLQKREPLVLTGDPSTWGTAHGQEITLGSKFGAFSVLSAVTCTSATNCVAVGTDGKQQPLVLAGNPATWNASKAKQITLGTAFGSGGSLASIACKASAKCVAVGQDKKNQPLVLVGNPATWSASQAKQVTLGTSLGSKGALASVACTTSTYCVGVGESGSIGKLTDKAKPLVVKGNPSTWTAKNAFNLRVPAATGTTVGGFSTVAGHGTGSLASISCRSASYCVVVGGDNHKAAVILAGAPTSWTSTTSLFRPAQNGPFTTATILSSYCVPTVCFASGRSNGGDFVATIQ